MKILLQFPQGLKQYALAEAGKYEKEGHEIFLSSSPCWGACDLAIDEAKKIGAQKLIHYGHSKFQETNEKEINIEYKLFPIDANLQALKNSLPKLKNYKKLALVTTVSHIHQLNEMKKILTDAGHEIFTEKGALASMEGQVLGCDAYAASKLADKVDAIIYFGGGKFHPLGIDVKKPILAVNPYAKGSEFINEHLEKKRKKEKGMLIAASQAKTIGIILSTKTGQFNLKIAENAKKKLKELGKNAQILVSNEIDFISLKDFNIFDAYITTACPRLIDDTERIEKPVINISQFPELLVLIGKTRV
ncbi:MAG: diphthamide biosynthesis enzyme Dph2 [Candidatus Micrarchaeota archaeon]